MRSRSTYGDNHNATPDLVQEAFCNAFANLPSAHHDVIGWLLAHAARACIAYEWSNRRYIRAAKAIEAEARVAEQLADITCPSAGEAEDRPEPHSDLEQALAQELNVPAKLGRIAFVQALARLTPDQRKAVQLRFLDGLPRDMRADELRRTPNAVSLLERRALRNLRAEFSGIERQG